MDRATQCIIWNLAKCYTNGRGIALEKPCNRSQALQVPFDRPYTLWSKKRPPFSYDCGFYKLTDFYNIWHTVYWPGPFQGWFVRGRLGHATINLPTKFEVPNFTHYENMKGVAKCRKWDGSGWLEVTQGYRQCRHSIDCTQLPIRL